MAISPPSDIVLDVAKAVDPMSYTEAVGRLRTAAGPTGSGAAPEGFEAVLGGFSESRPRVLSDAGVSMTARGNNQILFSAEAADPRDRAYRNFEAMALSTFVETMLPERAEGVFGSGTAGSMWRSLLAEKIAAEMASAGGVGIAEQMYAADLRRTAGPDGDGAAETAAAEPRSDAATLLTDAMSARAMPVGALPALAL